MERKIDGYSLEFDRGLVGIPTLEEDAVAVAEVVAVLECASALISGV